MSPTLRISRTIRWSVSLFAVGLVCLLSGCVSETVAGDKSTFKYDLYVFLVWTVVCGVLAPVGWALRDTSERWGYGLLIGAPAIYLLLGPSYLTDYIVVDDQHIETRWGFWFMPTKHNVTYENMKALDLTSREETGRRGRKSTKFYLVASLNSGESVEFPLNDLIKASMVKMLQNATAKNIPVRDFTQ